MEWVAFQPERTSTRISDLLFSLFSGLALISGFLLFVFGWRTSLIISASVPAISLIGLFLFYLSGGVLHQISIAAFIISIGQFIDNLIVVADSMKRKIAAGSPSAEAAEATFRELKRPMMFATLTGICAFIPLLAAQGSTADFIFSFPWVAILTLISSYFYAVYVMPLLAENFLKSEKPEPRVKLDWLERKFSSIALGDLRLVGVLTIVIVLISSIAAIDISKEFFPEADRAEFLFSVELGANSDILATDQVLKDAERFFSKDARVISTASFAGGDIPKFYYNLPTPRRTPQIGMILVTTETKQDVKSLGIAAENEFSSRYPDAEFVSYFLQQGPPIPAKVELRFFSQSEMRFSKVVAQVESTFKKNPHLRAFRSDLDENLEQIGIRSDAARLEDLNMDRSQIAALAAFESSGLVVGVYRAGREIVPIRLRSVPDVNTSEKDLLNRTFAQGRVRDFSLSEVASISRSKELSLIRRENGNRDLTVRADLKPDSTFDEAISKMKPDLSKIALRASDAERFEWGGDAKGAGEANQSVLKVVPLALMLLMIFLLLEFRSYRKLLISVVALPASILGIFPGLWLGGQPFGFMSLLGLLGLVGITLNNILLLTSDDSALWPPLGWTMISGLLTGTIATLIVVPALYRLLFLKQKISISGSIIFCAILLPTFSSVVSAESIDVLMDHAEEIHEYAEEKAKVEALNFLDRANFREAFLPSLQLGAEGFQRNDRLTTNSAAGVVTAEEDRMVKGQVELRWTLFDWSKMIEARDASKNKLEAGRSRRQDRKAELRLMIGLLSLGILSLEENLNYVSLTKANLRSRRKDVEVLVRRGRLPKSDLPPLELEEERVAQREYDLMQKLQNEKANLLRLLKRSEWVSLEVPAFRLPEDLGPTSDAGRSTLQALKEDADALQARASEFQREMWPKIDIFARGLAVRGDRIREPLWDEFGVGVRWEIFGKGARLLQASALEAEALGVEKSRLARQRQIEFLRDEAIREMRSQKDLIARLKRIKKSAELNRKLESERYFSGRASLRDLVTADDLLLQIDRDIVVASLEGLGACLRYQFQRGLQVQIRCELTEAS